jgi:hypothetical protein
MSTHTKERITRAGHRQLTTESGKALFEAFSGAVGAAEADANEERMVLAWNAHDALLAALQACWLVASSQDTSSGAFEKALELTNKAFLETGVL